ncbi:hypothetical protein [Pseudaminobacter soli (ex Li et al. 2025)]|uniref:Uncharacterized protein n=1 Tax=Pseudaminobacter soli (ex Li et al. 2025) TaxID=1295366 RepID=A0A2P7SID1_9HYPH|nr:hypothetical protein [Mesorhizobium soli]PSJ62238.1 hypothetical protein C7I85_07980 [Mesorhizobium soli]
MAPALYTGARTAIETVGDREEKPDRATVDANKVCVQLPVEKTGAMMAFRAVQWKRNLNKIPQTVTTSLADIKTDLVVAAVTKLIRPSEIRSTYRHLAFPSQKGEVQTSLPSLDMGKYSTRNQHGWDVVRRDLPMITKTYYWETPNFGDASTYGTHLHYQDREVFQREFHEPRMYRLTIEMLRDGAGGDNPSAYRVALDHQLDRGTPAFDQELLFMLNLLQENVGAAGVFSSGASREDYLGTLHLDWQVFPPGNQAEIVRAMAGGRRASREEEAIVTNRVALFSRLRPRAFLRGSGGLSSYVGAQYADDLVVFENIKYGNALYILYDNWEEVSQRSRLELLRGTDVSFDRVVHAEGWEGIFQRILQKEKRRRRIRD